MAVETRLPTTTELNDLSIESQARSRFSNPRHGSAKGLLAWLA